MLATISLKKIPWLSSAIYEILSKVGNFCVNRYRECTFFLSIRARKVDLRLSVLMFIRNPASN